MDYWNTISVFLLLFSNE